MSDSRGINVSTGWPTLDVEHNEPRELQLFRAEIPEPSLKSSDDTAADVSTLSFSDPLHGSTGSVGQLGGATTLNVSRQDAGSATILDDSMPAYKIAAALDASQRRAAVIRDSATHALGNEVRQELRSSLAYEIARINPGKIYSVVFVPMVDHDIAYKARVEDERSVAHHFGSRCRLPWEVRLGSVLEA